MDENPSYYSILTANVRYDERLKANEKIMYSEITALSNINGYCHASNTYFSKLYKKDKSTISRWISHLEECGYIKVELVRDDSQKIIMRKIYIATPLLTKKSIPYEQKSHEGIDEKVKENITRVNTTSNNSSSSSNSETSENPYELYQQITGRNLTGLQQPKMIDFIKTDGAELVVSALKQAKYIADQSDSKPSYNLFDSVIREWEDKGVKNVEQAREYEKQRLHDRQERMKKSRQSYYGRPTIDKKIPESMKEEYDPEKDKLSDEDKASLEKELAEFYKRGKEEQ